MRVLQTLTSLLAFFTFFCSGYRVKDTTTNTLDVRDLIQGLEVGPEELYEGAADEDVLGRTNRILQHINKHFQPF